MIHTQKIKIHFDISLTSIYDHVLLSPTIFFIFLFPYSFFRKFFRSRS